MKQTLHILLLALCALWLNACDDSGSTSEPMAGVPTAGTPMAGTPTAGTPVAGEVAGTPEEFLRAL